MKNAFGFCLIKAFLKNLTGFLILFFIGLQTARGQTKAQLAFMEMQYGMFIHYGINTFNDKEWSYGDLPLGSINVDSVDTDLWCRVAKKSGIKYLIFTTKHVDGYCNWFSQYTGYGVKNTRTNKDLVKQLAASCARYGLKLGLYYCLWDENQADFRKNEQAYNEYVRSQITELLTGYGPIACIWFDGFWKRQKTGWTNKSQIEGEKTNQKGNQISGEQFMAAWRQEGAFRWEWDQLYLEPELKTPGAFG